jgi:hypothetical protein
MRSLAGVSKGLRNLLALSIGGVGLTQHVSDDRARLASARMSEATSGMILQR